MSKLVINKYSVDKKELSVIITFLSWLFLGFIIIFMGVNNVFAATYYLNYEYRQQYYNNHGSFVETINTTWNESLQSYVSGNIPTTANSYGAGLAISTPIPIITNHTYTISFYFEDISNIALSSKKNIAIGMSLSSASGNYASNNFWAETLQSSVKNNSIIQYVFKANGGADYIFIPWTTTTSTSQSYVVTQIIMEDLGSEGLSQEQINISLNNQTNELNNSIQNSTNIVIGEINEIEQSIVESNKETQEVIKDQFNDCRDSYNLFDINRAYSYGSETSSSVTGNTLTINGKWFAFQIYNLEQNTDYYLTFEKEILQYAPGIGLVRIFGGTNTNNIIKQIDSTSFSFNTGNNTSVGILFFSSTNGVDIGIIKLSNIMLNLGNIPKPYEQYGQEFCTNKIDETNDKLDNLNGSLNNSNSSGATNDASNFFSNFTTDTFGLTSIITAPLSLINNLTSSSCSTLRLPIPYLNNKYLELPCMETIYSRYFGSFFNIYQTITFGIVAYWVIVRIFNQVKDFKNPDHDEIEVLDL